MIEYVNDSGFCFGVKNAFDTAMSLVPKIEGGQAVYLYGNLANNKHVMDLLASKGFIITESLGDIAPASIVVIRSHGVPRVVFDILQEKGVVVIDCTCSVVKKIHKIVQDRTGDGDYVLIIGQKGHPEVVGIQGWCGVVNDIDEMCKTRECEVYGGAASSTYEAGAATERAVTVVGQTTCDRDLWETAVKDIMAKYPRAKIYNTLCDVVAKRVERAKEAAEKCGGMVIVGDMESANSKKLYNSCKAVCSDVRFVTCVDDVLANEDLFISGKQVGIAGSASTPGFLLEEIHNLMLFLDFLHEVRRDVAAESDRFFEALLVDCGDKLFLPEAIKDLMARNQGGKAIRAAMIRLGEIAAGGDGSLYLRAGICYELFQTSILIHDDIIDKSDMRRGKKTIHSDKGHFGISRAICIGDMGFFLSNQILAEWDIPWEILRKILRRYAAIQLTTLDGEIMDVSLPHLPIDIETSYNSYMATVRKIYETKTAWYTLAGPVLLGADLGGAENGLHCILEEIALPLGVAFQVKDDILGMFAEEKTLGKSVLSDMREMKQTLMYGFAAKNANPGQKEILERNYGNPEAGIKELEALRGVFISSGALAFAEGIISNETGKCLKAIERLDEKHRPLFYGLVQYLTHRRY